MQDRSVLPTILGVAVPCAPAPDALNIWRVTATGSSYARMGSDPWISVWCAEFTVGPMVAASFLQEQARALATVRTLLPEVDRRLGKFVASASSTGDAVIALSGQMAAPERELATWLSFARGQMDTYSAEPLLADWWKWEEEVRRFIEQVRLTVTHAAWVETRADGRLLARTEVAWLRSARTTSVLGLTREWTTAHQKLVALSLESRAIWLHLAFQALGAAAVLGVLLPSGNVVLALPAAWHYVRSLIADLRRLAALQNAPGVT